MALLTPKDVEEAVKNIAYIVGDDEAAHSEEDKLHQRVLEAIANDQCAEPETCATIALKTRDIKFARWCA